MLSFLLYLNNITQLNYGYAHICVRLTYGFTRLCDTLSQLLLQLLEVATRLDPMKTLQNILMNPQFFIKR
jgi:hypothetical protein